MDDGQISVAARASRRKSGAGGPALIARGTLDVFNDRLEFGSWRLPAERITRARFERRFHKRDGAWRAKSNRLRLTCDGYDYKFRLEPLEDLRGQLPFAVEDREVRLKPAGPLFHVVLVLLLALAYGVHRLL